VLADGINELGFFQYALHLSKQRAGAASAALAGDVPSVSASPAFFEQRIRQQIEEGAAASAARAEARRAAGRVPRSAEPVTTQTPSRAASGAVEDVGPAPALMATPAASAASCACGECGAALAPTAKFCSECGSQRACAACGTPLARTAKFCSECGTPRAGGQALR
jgi:predicted nucleic acid-binding Zn ribbon protein